ncbi:MAG: radical SAM protein [Lentisphaeria bacterium]
MKATLLWRIFKSCTWRVLWQLIFNFAWKGAAAVRHFERRQKKNRPFFPAFLMLSITNHCNLRCRGCWVEQTHPSQQLSLDQLHGIVATAQKYGSSFFGILGGEPLLYPELFSFLEAHQKAYFQLFTNGFALDRACAEHLARLGNITPLISIEGMEEESCRRRGKSEVFSRALSAVEEAVRAGLFVGVSASITKNNFTDLVSEEYLDFLISKGVHYIWYYIYRPVGRNPEPANALSGEQIRALREFVVEQRCKAGILIIDAYWDHQGRALCPGATGLSHHISPGGAVEFCPPIQFASGVLGPKAENLEEILQQPPLLKELRSFVADKTRGCILLEDPQNLAEFLRQHQARDSSNRDAYAELMAMSPLPGHDLAEPLLPEKSWVYRFAKKYYFFGFGAYG